MNRPSALAVALLGLLLGFVPAFAAPSLPPERARDHQLAVDTIRCDCGCHPQSVHDCACGRAAEMREEIAAEVLTGKSGKQVIELYVARFGEQILLEPPARGFNLVAWIGPTVLIVLAGGGLGLALARWRRRPAPAEMQTAPETASHPERYLQRIREDLEEYR